MRAWIRELLVHYPHTYRRATPAAWLRPRLDVLEDRLTPAVHEWTGQGANNLWSNAANWTNGSPATDGSGDIDLVFHTNLTNAARLTSQNDIAGLVIDSITFDTNAGSVAGTAAGGLSSAGYTINGNALTIDTGGTQPGLHITAGVSNAPPNALVETINAGIILAGSPATFQAQDASARLVINGSVNNGGQALTIDSLNTLLTNNPTTAGVELNGVLSGGGSLTKVSGGSLLLSGANTYSGGTTVNGGTTVATNNSSLGAVAATTTVNDPARLFLRNGITVQQALLNLNSNALGGGLGTDGNTTNTFTGPITLMAGNGGVALGAGIGAAEANSRLIINGVIGGATSTLSLNGAGVIEFTQNNTYTGLTNLNGNNGFGSLQIDTPAGLGAGGPGNEIQLNRNGAGPTGSALWLNFSGTLQSLAAVGEIINFAGSGVNGTGAIRLLGDNDVTLPGNINFIAGAPWFFGVDVATATLTTTGVIADAGTNRALTKVGPGTLIIAGTAANTFGGGTIINTGTVRVQNTSATPLGVITAGGNITIADGATLQLQNVAGPITIPNPLIIQGSTFAAGTLGAVENLAGNNTLTGSITLPTSGQATISVAAAADTLTAGGIIGGAGGLIKAGPGALALSGLNNNNYAGTTTVRDGVLSLGKTGAGNVAVPGPLVIGDNLPNPAAGGVAVDSAVVSLVGANQIAAGANVTINADGRLNLNNNAQTVSALTMTGGTVQNGTGTLSLLQDATLTGFVDAAGTLRVAAIQGGTVRLNGGTAGTRTITVNPTAGATADHADAQVTSVVADGPAGAVADLVKAGTGVLSLTGNNTYDGTTLISAGQVIVATANGLGDQAAAAVTVAAGAGLRAGSGVTIAKPVNLGGPGYVSPFSGPTAALEADGTGASNGAQFSGTVTLSDDAAGNGSTVGLFAGDPGDSLRLTGVIQGAGGLTALRGLVQETGTAANTYTGLTTVNAGATLELNRVNAGTPQVAVPGDLVVAGTVLVDAGVLGGANAGSEIAPTSDVTLTGGTLTLAANAQQAIGDLRGSRAGTVDDTAAGSQLTFAGLTAQLGGTAAGTSYDQVTFLGAVNLNNAALDLQLGFQPAVGDSFVLIANDGADAVAGTFAGLAEGATVTVDGTTFAVTYAGGDGNDVALTVQSVPQPPPPPPPPGGPEPALAGGNQDGTAVPLVPVAGGPYQLGPPVQLFPGLGVNARVATADVTGDGVADYVGGTGPGITTRVAVIDGATGTELVSFSPFEASFTGGVFVAAQDMDGDGKAEVVVSPDQGGGPVAAVYAGAKLAAGTGGDAAQVVRFFGIDDPAFRGGARPTLGDVTGDGTADLVVSAGFLGGPRITVWDGASILAGTPGQLLNFFAFEDTLRNGAFVAAGDVTGDGAADVAFGGGPGGAPRVRLFDGKALLAAGPFTNLDEVPTAQLANFFAGDAALRGGVRLALKDVTGDETADLLTGSGEGEASRVRVYLGPNLLANANPAADQELDPFAGAVLANGVFVG